MFKTETCLTSLKETLDYFILAPVWILLAIHFHFCGNESNEIGKCQVTNDQYE